MFFIFGRGLHEKEIARSEKRKCPNCNNITHFRLLEYADKVVLFFLPIVTYRKKYTMSCSICSACFEFDENDKEEFLRKCNTGERL
jgi:hypothetical protein